MLEAIIQFLTLRLRAAFPEFDIKCLSEKVQDDDRFYLGEYQGGGDYEPIDFDTAKGLIYFRRDGEVNISEADDEGAISCEEFVRQTIPFRVVMYAPKDMLQTDNAYIDNKLAENCLNKLKSSNDKDLRTLLGASAVYIRSTGYTTDRSEVEKEEFEGLEVNTDSAWVLAAFTCEAEIIAPESCFTAWGCRDGVDVEAAMCRPVIVTDGMEQIQVASGDSYQCMAGAPVEIENSVGDSLGMAAPGDTFIAPDGTIKDGEGATIGQVPSGGELVIAAVGSVTITNSEDTELAVVGAGNTYEAPDGVAKNSEGAEIASIPSGGEEVIADVVVKNTAGDEVDLVPVGTEGLAPDVVITKYDGVTTVNKPAGTTYNETTLLQIWAAIDRATKQAFVQNTMTDDERNMMKASQARKINYVGYNRTGQTTNFATGDDGFYQKGKGADFLTLSANNRFGNTNRFTAVDGSQDYSGGSAIDHLTNLEWYLTPQNGASTWALSIAAAESATFLSHTDWRMPNRTEMNSIVRILQGTAALSYAPFNLTTLANNFMTSSTYPSATTNAVDSRNNSQLNIVLKTSTSSYFYLLCRDYYTD